MSELEQKRILIIDDNQNLLEALSDLLEDRGYIVSCALDGAKGLKKIEEELFELAIIDLNLPDLNGIEVMQRVREKNKEIMIIIITGDPSKDIPIKAMNLGAFNYIKKPYKPELMCETIDRALEQHKMRVQNALLLENFNDSTEELKQLLGEKVKFWTSLIKEFQEPLNMANSHLNILDELIHNRPKYENQVAREEKVINIIQININRLLNLVIDLIKRPRF